MSWTDERIELLRKLWLEGLSASQIARELANGISRNAVIGKVHRLGMSGRVKTAAPASVRPKVKTARPVVHQRMSAPMMRGNTALAAQIAADRSASPGTAGGGCRDPDVRNGDDHGAEGIHVPLADGRSVLRRIPLLRRQKRRQPERPLLQLSRPHRLSAGAGSSPAPAIGVISALSKQSGRSRIALASARRGRQSYSVLPNVSSKE